jgi:hypothetical protein
MHGLDISLQPPKERFAPFNSARASSGADKDGHNKGEEEKRYDMIC